MDELLDEYTRVYTLTKQRILEEVDEWTLYYFYLGIEDLTTRTTYNSPIRTDDENPSFSIYENTRSKKEVEFLWKDSALNKSGDIFELLKLMFNISESEVLELINNDFAILDESREVVVKKIERPTKKSDCKIRVKSKPFSREGLCFWENYYVYPELLNWKQVKEVEYVWFNDSQECPFRIKELMFAYPEYNHEDKVWHYQLYCPYSKEFKFRNDLYENQIYGWNHLIDSDILVITKSNKDILCLKKFGVVAVSPRSETTRIKDKTIKLLQARYKTVYTLFDNDEAGIKASLDYELPSLFIPKESGCKDFSDYLKEFGEDKAKELLISLNII